MRRLDLMPSAPYFPTASELLRAAECVAPWALGLPESEDGAGEWAETGRRLHGFAEAIAKGEYIAITGCLPNEERIVEHLLVAIAGDALALKTGTELHVEQGIKWRPDFPAPIAEFVQRAPGERLRGWFSGTADLAYVRHDGVLVVADWKFGPRTRFVGERAKNHRQGWFLALAFATALEISGSSRDVVVARFEARYGSESGIEVDGYDITQGELDDWAVTLAGLAKRITGATDAMPRISAACGHCKAKEACPAWNAMEQAIVVDVMGRAETALLEPPRDPSDVRALHHAIALVEHCAAEWKVWRDAYVLSIGPVALGMGLRLEAKPTSKRSVLDTPEAMDMIEAVVGKAAIVMERSATCDSIKKAARDAAGDGIASTSDRNKAKKSAEENAFAKLIEGGAVRESGKTYTVRECRAGETEE